MGFRIQQHAHSHVLSPYFGDYLTDLTKIADWDGLDDSVETNTGIYVSPSDSGTDPNDRDTDNDTIPDRLEMPNDRIPMVVDWVVNAGMYITCALGDSGVVCWGAFNYSQSKVPALSFDKDRVAVADNLDNCTLLPNASQANNDGDVLGALCDREDDNDGMPDVYEVANNLDPWVRLTQI